MQNGGDMDLWQFLGVQAPGLFGGMAGGIVGCWVDGKSGFWAWAMYVLCGGLTGGYLAETGTHVIPFANSGFVGFAAGTSVMFTLRLLRGAINRYGAKLTGNGGG